MKSHVKCFDVVKMVTDEATSQFKPIFNVVPEREKILKSYCEVIDQLAEQFNGVAFEAEVDDETMDIAVSLICEEFVVDAQSGANLQRVADKAKYMGFRAADDERIQMSFVFGSIWCSSI